MAVSQPQDQRATQQSANRSRLGLLTRRTGQLHEWSASASSTTIFSRPSGRTSASSPPLSFRNRASSAGILTTKEFPDFAMDTFLARPQSPIFFARASISFIASWSTKDSPHESQISAGYSPRSIPNISSRTFPRCNCPLPQTGHFTIMSPPELNRDHPYVFPPHHIDDLEVHVGGNDLAVLDPLCSFPESIIGFPLGHAAKNHPLPCVTAGQDSPRHYHE